MCDYTHVRAPGDTMHKNLMTGQSSSDNPQIAGGLGVLGGGSDGG